MRITEAIEKAKKEGYSPKIFGFANGSFNYKEEVIFMDPKFWQCLGKELSWAFGINAFHCKTCFEKTGENIEIGWLYHWHRFIDHLAKGRGVEDFFKELN